MLDPGSTALCNLLHFNPDKKILGSHLKNSNYGADLFHFAAMKQSPEGSQHDGRDDAQREILPVCFSIPQGKLSFENLSLDHFFLLISVMPVVSINIKDRSFKSHI